MDPREFSHRWLPALVAWMDRFNQRHPWSHNDHFHPWIVRHLPDRRRSALDVGCGRGELLGTLANHFDQVHGTDKDADMRQAASSRVVDHTNASVDARQLVELDGSYDLITMIAALHHLDTDSSLVEVRRLLAPGGRLLVVGLARAESRLDWAWEVICLLTNPMIGMVKHPRPTQGGESSPGIPVADPKETYADLQRTFRHRLPGATLRRHLGFRYTAAWTKAR